MVPGGAVAEGDALHGNIAAIPQVKQPASPRDSLLPVIDPPVALLGAAVHNAFADDLHVFHADTGQRAGKAA